MRRTSVAYPCVGLSLPAVVAGLSVPAVVAGLSVPAVVAGLSVPAVVAGLSVPAVVAGLSLPAVVQVFRCLQRSRSSELIDILEFGFIGDNEFGISTSFSTKSSGSSNKPSSFFSHGISARAQAFLTLGSYILPSSTVISRQTLTFPVRGS